MYNYLWKKKRYWKWIYELIFRKSCSLLLISPPKFNENSQHPPCRLAAYYLYQSGNKWFALQREGHFNMTLNYLALPSCFCFQPIVCFKSIDKRMSFPDASWNEISSLPCSFFLEDELHVEVPLGLNVFVRLKVLVYFFLQRETDADQSWLIQLIK